jgi:hypothetical protein
VKTGGSACRECATDQLAEYIRTALTHCVQDFGFVGPLILTAVAVNGSLYAIRIDGETVEALADHSEGDLFALPVNIMVTDARGEAARVLIPADGEVHMLN